MTIEEQLRTELSRLTEQVRPAPDPLSRLVVRRRRARWYRSVVAAGAAVLVAGTAIALPQLAQPGGAARPLSPTEWVQRLVDAPPRGSVGTEPGYAIALAGALDAIDQAGRNGPELDDGHDESAAQRQVRVLLVEDVGDQRVAVVASLSPDFQQNGYADSNAVLLLARRGAPAATLAAAGLRDGRPAGTGIAGIDLLPAPGGEVSVSPTFAPEPMVAVELAPPGCQIATATLAAGGSGLTAWQPEPTGSFLLRSPDQRRAEWWQVSCDGVVRQENPAPAIQDPANPATVQISAEQAAAGLAQARGTPDVKVARAAMLGLYVMAGYGLAARPTLSWGGRLDDFPGGAADVAVAAAPAVDGGWIGQVTVSGGRREEDRGAIFGTPADPFDPATMLAIRLSPEASGTILVVAPAGAATVRARAAGPVLAQADVADGAAVLTGTPNGAVVIEALAADGGVIGQTTPVGPELTTRRASNWSS